ncbi:outer membrane protein assembly factor BamE [Sulfitobacter aestuariivivens]|uniref:Outer membrane protein assembly factor BamE n=1 Tax=Sulfitobacter aestuariivivens TaxID=2766981 RepID=A0A927HEI6_9RHOB|nr:outer membrane protein assembly factor BamE [Sulfitobacter aestuariivivens]MBD3663428.1 outer membrane protein assembly factor BamE [Sulfitobacter aestuariivivens]
MRTTHYIGAKALRTAVFCAAIGLSACAPAFKNHGYVPPSEDLEQIVVGSDTRSSVEEKIGVPSSAGVLNDGGYYYVRMRTRALGPLAPREIDRQVVAISFSSAGVVQNIETFGLEDGNVVPLQRRVTSSPVSDKSFIRQLLGNLGRFNPAALQG